MAIMKTPNIVSTCSLRMTGMDLRSEASAICKLCYLAISRTGRKILRRRKTRMAWRLSVYVRIRSMVEANMMTKSS